MLSLRFATVNDADEWNRIVDQDPLSTIFDRFEWCNGLRLMSEHIEPLPFFVEDANGEVLGVFPLCLRKEKFAKYLESTPYSDYGGGTFFRRRNDDSISRELANNLLNLGKEKNCFRVTIRRSFFDDILKTAFIDKPIIVEQKNCSFVISLKDELNQISKKIKKKRRQGIRHAKKRGTTIRSAESFEDIERYYEIYLLNMQRLNGPPVPLNFFKYLWEVFRPKGFLKIFLAENDNKIVAGTINLVHNKVIYVWGAASLSEHLNLRAMDLLDWSTINWGIKHKLDFLDFGATSSDSSSGIYNNKKSWGGEEKVLYNYHIILQPNKWKVYNLTKNLLTNVKKNVLFPSSITKSENGN